MMKLAIYDKQVKLHDKGDRICDHVRLGRSFEPVTRQLFGELCAQNSGRIVLDIGAYNGLFAIGAALHGCKVIAFEPMPFNYERLLQNVALNNVNITLQKAAVCDEDGDVLITYNPKVENTSGASMVRKKGEKLPITGIQLDTMFPASDPKPDVAIIKMDVERAEPLVLRGAKLLLQRSKPVLFVEALGDSERAAVMAELPGYHVARVIDKRNLLLMPNSVVPYQ